MKGSKEYRKWVNKLRKLYGKKNGVIKSFHLDSYLMEIEFRSNKRQEEIGRNRD